LYRQTARFSGSASCQFRQEAKLSLGWPTVLPHITFGGHVTSSVTWLFDSPYAISYWWSFGESSLYLYQFPRYSTSSVTQWLTWLDTTSKQVKVIHFGTNRCDFYRPIYAVNRTFALGRTV